MGRLRSKTAGFGLRDIMRGPTPAQEKEILHAKMFNYQNFLTTLQIEIFREQNSSILNGTAQSQKIAMLQTQEVEIREELRDLVEKYVAMR